MPDDLPQAGVRVTELTLNPPMQTGLIDTGHGTVPFIAAQHPRFGWLYFSLAPETLTAITTGLIELTQKGPQQ